MHVPGGSDDRLPMATDGAPTEVPGGAIPETLPLVDSSPPAARIARGIPRLPERYRAIDLLGRGGIGIVLRVEDRLLNRQVALKVLSASRSSDEARERFLIEARTTAQLSHPGIVPLHDLGQLPDGNFYVTMRIVAGRTLRGPLDEHQSHPTPRGRVALVRRLIDVGKALAHAHQRGVVHRDLKPENVMIGPFGETLVMDWGLAKILDDDRPSSSPTPPGAAIDAGTGTDLTQDGAIVGTLHYLSPEQARGEPGAIDRTTDVWALGVMLYEVLTGRRPFHAGSPTEILVRIAGGCPADPQTIDSTIPQELAAIALKCLDRNPARRYPTAAGVADDLQLFLEGRTVGALADPWPRRLSKLVRRNPWPTGALAFAAAAALVAVALAAWRIEGERARDAALLVADADRAVADLPVGPPDEDPGIEGRRRREAALEAHLVAVSALDRALLVAPDDERLRRQRREAGVGLGRVAMAGGDYTLARRAFRDLLEHGASATQLADWLAEVDRREDRERTRRRQRLTAMLDELATGLSTATATGRVEDLVLEAVGFQDEQTVDLIGRALGSLTSRAASGRASWTQADRDLARFACRVLGRIDSAGVIDRLSDWARVLVDPDLAAEVGVALCTTGRPEAWPGVLDLLARFGNTSRAWVRIREELGRLPDPRPLDPAGLEAGPLAAALLDRGDPAAAIEVLDRALAIAPAPDPRLLSTRGQAHLAAGDPAAARADLDQAIETDPACVEALSNRGLLRLRTGDPLGAIDDLDRALATVRHPILLVNRGLARTRTGDAAGAIGDFSAALDLDPERVDALFGRGNIHLDARDHRAAIADYTLAIALDPRHAGALLHRSRAHAEAGDLDLSIADLTRILEIDPRSAPAFHIRGINRWRTEDLAGAEADLRSSVELDGTRFDFKLPLARLLVETGRPTEALPLLEAARAEAPPDEAIRIGEWIEELRRR